MREARCLYPVKGHGGVKGKEYGTKEVRQARQKKGEICNKGQEVWEVGGRWQSGMGTFNRWRGTKWDRSSQARKIRSKFLEEQRSVNI